MVHKAKFKTSDGKDISISREDFIDYEQVRLSGLTNMFDVRNVIGLSGLSREKVHAIMRNYSKLDEMYPGVRGSRVD